MAATLACGCSSGSGASSPRPASPDDGLADMAYVPEVHFTRCSLATEKDDGLAECATAKVPLAWEHPDGPRIDVFVKRVTHGHGGPALFAFGGRPGDSGVGVEPLAATLTRDDAPAVDVYLVDLRGTGRSTKLTCPPEEGADSPAGIDITASEWPGCLSELRARWGPDVVSFRPDEAVRDVVAIAAATLASGQRAFVYGSAFGAYVVSAFAAARPVAGAVLDSPCLPGSCFFSDDEAWASDAGQRLMKACAADATCRLELGDDPWSRVGQALDAVDDQTCPPIVAASVLRRDLRALFASWLVDEQRRVLIPALTRRILRCDASDFAALTKFATDLTGPHNVAAARRYASPVLAAHVTLSELWESPPPVLANLAVIDQTSYFATGDNLALVELDATWPKYTTSVPAAWPSTTRVASETATIVLDGTLDPASPLGAPEASQSIDGATVVTLPGSTGGAAFQSSTVDGDPTPCGARILESFLANGGNVARVDSSCVTKLAPLRFDGHEGLAQETFGTSDLWEN